MTNKERLEIINREIYYTYHDKKNKDALPIAIFWAFIVIIFKNPLFWEGLVWGIYYSYCSNRNKKLKNNPSNLKNRQFWMDYKKEVLEGNWDFVEN